MVLTYSADFVVSDVSRISEVAAVSKAVVSISAGATVGSATVGTVGKWEGAGVGSFVGDKMDGELVGDPEVGVPVVGCIVGAVGCNVVGENVGTVGDGVVGDIVGAVGSAVAINVGEAVVGLAVVGVDVVGFVDGIGVVGMDVGSEVVIS